MRNWTNVTEDILQIGINDRVTDLFEGQYKIPNGISYNAYVILDEKVCLLDTVDGRFAAEYLAALEEALGGREPEYLVVSHMEPDHSACIGALMEKYPEMRLVGNQKTFPILKRYFDLLLEERSVTVREGETLSLGRHELTFVMAPMVHWPEVMVAYDAGEKILFSADALGKFGALDCEEEWLGEARRYYFNIVGKFGKQVEMLLNKAKNLEIETVCPLHGPILRGEALAKALEVYAKWGAYAPEEKGVLVAYASLHGNTAKAARAFEKMLRDRGAKVEMFDLAREDLSEVLSQAFRLDTMVLMASSYDAGVMPFMETFLAHLKAKNYQKRRVALVENASFAPSANRTMREILSQMREISVEEEPITIFGSVKPEDLQKLEALADKLA